MPGTWPRSVALLLLAAFFVFAGVMHFAATEFFVAIVPHWLPAPLALVYVSGIAEIVGGLAVLLPAARSLAGWWLVALLLAVFPANLQMALEAERWVANGTPRWALYARLPIQFLLIAWAWWATRPATQVEEVAAWRS